MSSTAQRSDQKAATQQPELQEPTDHELVQAYIEGDSKAFSAIVERHRKRLTYVARKYTRSDDEAQDVVQEALLRASSKIHTFRREAALGTWLHRLVMNSGYDYLNHRANRENLSLDSADFSDDRNPLLSHHPNAGLDEHLTLKDALSLLREDQRTALYLTDIAGYPISEVAAAQGVRPGTIKSRRSRAREVLRAAMN